MNRHFRNARLVAAALILCAISAGCDIIANAFLPPAPSDSENSDAAPSTTGSRQTYLANFDNDGCGWIADRRSPLLSEGGAAKSSSPWFVDYWHAPPGAGYIHLIIWIHTHPRLVYDYYPGYEGNSFVDQDQSRNLTNARLSARIRGDIDLKGAQLVLLVQSEDDETGVRPNYILSERPFTVGPTWSEQSVILSPDPDLWTCMGARHDVTRYGCTDIADVLSDVNIDMMFVLYPLNVVPLDPNIESPDLLRAGAEYDVDETKLPNGSIYFDWVKLEYPESFTESQNAKPRANAPVIQTVRLP